jgi:Tat protein secretion system quality control protein TatD with DNase activity
MEETSTVHTETITYENMEEKMNELRMLYAANKEYVIAIGECGIDLHYP